MGRILAYDSCGWNRIPLHGHKKVFKSSYAQVEPALAADPYNSSAVNLRNQSKALLFKIFINVHRQLKIRKPVEVLKMKITFKKSIIQDPTFEMSLNLIFISF